MPGGVTKQTPSVPRDINPIWKKALMLSDVTDDDRLDFRVVDVGVFAESHLGERLGPRVIASTSLPLKDFEGFVELQPYKAIPGQGSPVLEVAVRVFHVHTPGLPPIGHTQAMVGMVEASAPPLGDLEGVGVQACAGDLEGVGVQACDTTDTSGVEACGGAGDAVGKAGDPADPAFAGDPDQTCAGDPAEACGSAGVSAGQAFAPGVSAQPCATDEACGRVGVPPNTSSVFHIDELAYKFGQESTEGQVLSQLEELQKSGKPPFPFPEGDPLRNYNFLACGFVRGSEREDGKAGWHTNLYWGESSADKTAGLRQVREQMEKFAARVDHPHWCEGVLVIAEFLKACEAGEQVFESALCACACAMRFGDEFGQSMIVPWR